MHIHLFLFNLISMHIHSWNNCTLNNNSGFSTHLFQYPFETGPPQLGSAAAEGEILLRPSEELQISCWKTGFCLLAHRRTSVSAQVPSQAPVNQSDCSFSCSHEDFCVVAAVYRGGDLTDWLPASKWACEASCDAQDLDILTQISSLWCRFNVKHSRILRLSTQTNFSLLLNWFRIFF